MKYLREMLLCSKFSELIDKIPPRDELPNDIDNELAEVDDYAYLLVVYIEPKLYDIFYV